MATPVNWWRLGGGLVTEILRASNRLLKTIFVRSMTSFKEADRWIDALWGYDVFIAHRRSDAAQYAQAIYAKLTAERISCFIDKVVYGPGDSLLVATNRHVRKSTIFFLVGSPELLIVREPVDWVKQEIEAYLSSHERAPQLILVDVGSIITDALAQPLPLGGRPHPILSQLEPFVRITEDTSALTELPSEEVLSAIRRSLDGRRRDQTRLRLFQVVAIVLACLLIVTAALTIAKEQERKHAESRRLLVETRASLASPPATQTAILQARAARYLRDSAEARSVAGEVIGRLATPTLVVRTGKRDMGAHFAAFFSDSELLLETSDATALLSLNQQSGEHDEASFLTRRDCDSRIDSTNGRRSLCWSASRVQVVDVLTDRTLFERELPEFGDDSKLVMDRKGMYFAVANEFKAAVVEIESGNKRSVKLPRDGWPPFHMAVSSDGRHLALSPNSITIDGTTPAFVVDVQTGNYRIATRLMAGINDLEFTSGNDLLAIAASDGRIEIFNLAGDNIERQFQSLPGLRKLSITNDSRFFAVSNRRATTVYALATGQELAKAATGGPVYHIAFDHTGTRLVTAGATPDELSTLVVVWNLLNSSDFASVFAMPNKSVMTIGFGSNDRLLQKTTEGVRSVNLNTGAVEFHPMAYGFDVNVIQVALGAHQAFFLGRNVFSNTLGVRNLAGIPVGPDLAGSGIAATPDGKTIVTLWYSPLDPTDSLGKPAKREARIKVWRATNSTVRQLSVPWSADSVSVDSAGKYIVATFAEQPNSPSGMAVYSVNGLRELASVEGNSLRLFAAVAPDGRTVIEAGGDRILIRRLPDLELLGSIQLLGPVEAVTFAPSGEKFAVIDGSGTASVYGVDGNLRITRRTFFEGSQRNALAISNNGEVLAVLSTIFGGSTLLLVSLQPNALDHQLCERLLEAPGSVRWKAILPNDKPPPPCTSPQRTDFTLKLASKP